MITVPAAWGVLGLSVSSAVSLLLAYNLRNRLDTPGALATALIMFSASMWAFANAGEIITEGMQNKLMWAYFRFPFISLVPFAWLMLASALTGGPSWLTKRVLTAFGVATAAVVVAQWSNGLHGLSWTDVQTVSQRITVLQFDRGPLFPVRQVLSYGQFALGVGILIAGAVRYQGDKRKQLVTVLIAGLIPTTITVLFILGIPSGIIFDNTPLAFNAAAALIGYSISRYNLFDVRQLAREALLSEIPDSVLILDTAGRVVEANPTAVRLLTGDNGSPSISGKHVCEMVRSESSEHPICNAIQRGQAVDTFHVQGSSIRADIQATTIHNRGENGSLVVIRDVSSLFESQAELQLKNALLESQAEAAPDGVVVVAEDGRWLNYNKRFLNIWGFNHDEAGQMQSAEALKRIGGMVHDPEAFARKVREIKDNDLGIVIDQIELIDGREFKRYSAPVTSPDGNRYGRLWSYTDVTEARQAASFATRLNHATLLNSIAEVTANTLDVTSAARASARVIAARLSARWVAILMPDPGYPDDMRVEALLDGRDGQFLESRSTDILELATGLKLEEFGISGSKEPERNLNADGTCALMTISQVETSAGLLLVTRDENFPFTDADIELIEAGTGQLGNSIDRARVVEKLQNTNTELKKARDLAARQARLSALGGMASGIAHDINNALSPVVGFSEILLKQKDKLDSRTVRFLSAIRTAALDVTRILHRMREFYRERPGESELEEIDVKKIIDEVILLTTPRWKDQSQGNGNKITVTKRTSPGIPLVRGLPHEIRETLTNLIINACDAMPEGGNITIATRPEFEQASNQDIGDPDTVVIVVSDTGTGMDLETAKKAIDPFFSTKGENGTGLGLAMVDGVMQRHGGTLKIDSKPNEGTSIELRFPVEGPIDAQKSGEEAGPPTVPLNILVIDDEPMLRDLLTQILESEGHRVATAANGQAGIAKFASEIHTGSSFDAVITDLGMPEMNGNEVMSRINMIDDTCPVILLTGWTGYSSEDEQGVAPAGELVLSKPPRIKEIREALASVIASSEKATPTSA